MPAQAAARVADEVRRMIVSGELLPGHPVRQEHMADRLGVSRLPVREALRQLAADGLVCHIPNLGYPVRRLSQEDFGQIYTMRRLLEAEVVRDLPRASDEQLAEITALADAVADAGDQLDVPEMRARNQDFHFAIFRLSPHPLIVDEIERLWDLAAPYHAMYLYSADGRRTVLAEHAEMIGALREADNARLAALMEQHRHGSETHLFAGPAGPGLPRADLPRP
jgi:DNA-binding GntR family transcriptional regulator